MKPYIITPEEIAKRRFTTDVRRKRNIDVVTGLSAMHGDEVSAINYINTGNKLTTATGRMLDAWGERYSIDRQGMSDDQYRNAMLVQGSGKSVSLQSRPAVGAYIMKVYGITWLLTDGITVISGAVGATLNRAPLGRVIYAQFGGMAPLLAFPESLVSATFSGIAYSAAVPANATLTDNAAMFPGNVFQAVWGGLNYVRIQRAIRVSPGITIRVKSGTSVLTRETTNEIVSQSAISPFNTLPTAQIIEVTNG